jgi:hypothetical protein
MGPSQDLLRALLRRFVGCARDGDETNECHDRREKHRSLGG